VRRSLHIPGPRIFTTEPHIDGEDRGIEHVTSFGVSVTPPTEAEAYRQAVLENNDGPFSRSDARRLRAPRRPHAFGTRRSRENETLGQADAM
jgi:hypothetical protein